MKRKKEVRFRKGWQLESYMDDGNMAISVDCGCV